VSPPASPSKHNGDTTVAKLVGQQIDLAARSDNLFSPEAAARKSQPHVGGTMRIGIDIGGTKTQVIALDDMGKCLLRRRVGTPADDDSAVLRTVVDLVVSAEHELGRKCSVGVGTPGAVSQRTGNIKNSNGTTLNGKPLHQDLSAKLGRPIRVENSANCFALSEAIDGAGAGAQVVFGVIIGTGVGGGIVSDQRLISGRNRIAGEWGHCPLPWMSEHELKRRVCYCGKTDCIETWLSGRGLSTEYELQTGRRLAPPEIAQVARLGDRGAAECMKLYQDRLARGIAGVINVLDPDLIVLGGGLSNLASLYDNLPEVVSQYVFSDFIDTPIVPPFHGDSSGVRGAAWLWPNQ
jgi:fructokinase